MNETDTSDVVICSFCSQQIKIPRTLVGKRTKCPKCARVVFLFPNRGMVIDSFLTTTWYYQRPRLLLASDQIGPITDDKLIELVRAGAIESDCVVWSPEQTNSQRITLGQLNVSSIQEKIEQRVAEQIRRSRRDERKQEIAATNRERLARGISAAIADGRVTLQERGQLFDFAKAANIPNEELEALLQKESKRLVDTLVEETLSDGILDSNEKQRISDLALGLGVRLEFTKDQLRKLEACELAWQITSGEFQPRAVSCDDVGLNSDETPFARVNAVWHEIVQQKKPAGIALGDSHYLKEVATGDCVLTNKRLVLVSKFTAKKIAISSVESVGRFCDGVLCRRSTGKSVFLRYARSESAADQFGMLLEFVVSNRPVLGTLPTESFVPDLGVDFDVSATSPTPSYFQYSQVDPRYTFRVVGDHIGERSSYIHSVNLGEQLHLLREPTNPYDANAVSVLDPWMRQLGYLKREVASWFGPMMDRGYGFRCQAYRKPTAGGLIVGVFEA